MRIVIEYVMNNPGCPKLHPARHCMGGTNQGLAFGYKVVDRCILAGYLTNTEPSASKPYALEVTDAGRAAIALPTS